MSDDREERLWNQDALIEALRESEPLTDAISKIIGVSQAPYHVAIAGVVASVVDLINQEAARHGDCKECWRKAGLLASAEVLEFLMIDLATPQNSDTCH